MAQQTINVGTSPNDGTGTPLRTAFQYTNSNFSELYTAVGPSGNNIVVPGSATITGDLTVDTSTLKVDSANNRVGINTASPGDTLDVNGRVTALRYLASSSNAALPAFAVTAGNGTYSSGANEIGFSINSTSAMTLNSTGLGVGGSPATKIFASVTPPGAGQDGMRVSDGTRLIQMSISGSSYSYQGIGANQNVIYASGNPMSILSDAQNLRLGTSATSYVLLDTSGNVGVGVTPSATDSTYFQALEIARVGQGLTAAKNALTGSPSSWLSNNSYATYSSGVVWKYAISQPAAQYRLFEGQHQWFIAPSGTAGNNITFTQAMTLDASGNLLVGKTASSTTVAGSQVQPDGTHSAVKSDGNPGFFYNTTTAISGTIALFRSNGVTVGSISQDGTNTAYNNSSDYRLKESVQPLTGGLARVNALKPSIYKWKTNGKVGEGFLAHELAEVVPFAVTGEKDAVTKNGEIEPQQVDLSKVVPILVAAIKELSAEVNALKNA